MDCLKASDVDCMQIMRIIKNPIKVQDDLIVVDELEHGILKLYKCEGGPLDIHLLFADVDDWKDDALVAKIVIEKPDQKEYVVITDILCDKRYEYLAAPMICQVVSFAKYYEPFKSVRISEEKKERWFFHASVLSLFSKKDKGYCEYIFEEKSGRA